MTQIHIEGSNNITAGRDVHLVQRGQFMDYLSKRQIDPARSELCAVCEWPCAKSATSCPCCGANKAAEMEHQVAAYMRKAVRPLMGVAVLIVAALLLCVAYGLSQIESGVAVSKAFVGTGPILASTFAWVGALYYAHKKAVASALRAHAGRTGTGAST